MRGQYFGRREKSDCPLTVIISLRYDVMGYGMRLYNNNSAAEMLRDREHKLFFFCLIFNLSFEFIFDGFEISS
jgi:hypothetical protein